MCMYLLRIALCLDGAGHAVQRLSQERKRSREVQPQVTWTAEVRAVGQTDAMTFQPGRRVPTCAASARASIQVR